MSVSLTRTQGGPIRGATGVAGPIPFGSPERLLALVQAVSENRHALGLARTLLREGICGACQVGSDGLYDEAGPHLCGPRLRRLIDHTRGHFVPADVLDVERLRAMDAVELRSLGRVPRPLIWRAGDRGLTAVGWDEAMEAVRSGWGPSRWRARGGSREELSAFARAARHVTTDWSIASAAPWRAALSETLGTTRATASARDVMTADVVLVWGCNLASSNPTLTGWLARAKQRGARVVVVNAVVEAGLERTWGLAPFGHRLADDRICLRPGADARLTNAVLERWIAWGVVADLDTTTTGLPELGPTDCGVPDAEVDWLATVLARAETMVTLFGSGVDGPGVRGLVNLHLARDAVGRDGCGLVPLTGASRDALDVDEARGSARLHAEWGAPSSEAAGDLEVLFGSEGRPCRARVVADTHLRPSALADVDELLVVLPAAGRHEQAGTFTSVFGNARYAEALVPTLAESRPAADIALDLVGLSGPTASVPAGPARPCRDGEYALPRGLAVLSTVDADLAQGFVVTVRRGLPRGLVHIGPADAARLGLTERTSVHVVTEHGRAPCRLEIHELPAGIVQVGRVHRSLLGGERWAQVRVEVA